jgi:acyl-lipid omega-6 desaturase (Delta-12 desaturase)
LPPLEEPNVVVVEIADDVSEEAMSAAIASRTARVEASAWVRKLQPYRKADALRGTLEIAVTAIPFVLGWFTVRWALEHGHVWLYALLLLPVAGLLVRLFMIQHDCGHGSFVPSRWGNDWVGRALSVLTLTPYDHWRHTHAVHHANSGNLDGRGIGDVMTLTVAEYMARPWRGRLRYRLYRHPAVLLGFGPFYLFFLQNRLPIGFMRTGWKPWFSTMATNGAIAVACALMVLWAGPEALLLIHLPIVLLAALGGVWLFYVQHQFERTHWARGDCWKARESALHGSSHYDLPSVLKWLTANIGVHHVHHLASRIPYYRLPEVLHDHAELRDVGRLTWRQSLTGLRLVLWDEQDKRLISFKELRSRNM